MNDDEMLAALADAFPPDPSPPSRAVLAAIAGATAITQSPARRGRWRVANLSRWAAAATAGILAVGGGTAYAATGGTLPRPLRIAAHAIGLPVQSVQLVDLHNTEHRLQADLKTANAPAAVRDAAQLSSQLGTLGHDDRARDNGRAPSLIASANVLSHQPGGTGSEGPQAQSGDGSAHHGAGGTGPSSGSDNRGGHGSDGASQGAPGSAGSTGPTSGDSGHGGGGSTTPTSTDNHPSGGDSHGHGGDNGGGSSNPGTSNPGTSNGGGSGSGDHTTGTHDGGGRRTPQGNHDG